jgi:hypothetical protein
MDEIILKVNLGIPFHMACPTDNNKNIIGYNIANVMRYCRVPTPRTQWMNYDIGWTAKDFIEYYEYLMFLHTRTV